MAITNPYSSQTIANYNDDPPPNDASTGADNVVDWDLIKDELTDPVKTLAEALNTELVATFASVVSQVNNQLAAQFGFLDKSADYTIQSGDLAGELFVLVDASGGNVIIDLPTVAAMEDKVVTVIVAADPGTNTVRVDQSDSSTLVWYGYELGDSIRLTSDATNYQIISKNSTVYGTVALTADESITGNTATKIFDTNISVVSNVGGWFDSVTNFRIDVVEDCILKLTFIRYSASSGTNIVVYPRVNGTAIIDEAEMSGTGTDPGRVNTFEYMLELSAGDYVEAYAYNSEGGAKDVQGDAGNDQTQMSWTVLRGR